MRRFLVVLVVIALMCSVGSLAVGAQEYPTRAVTVIIPWSAGGMTDVSCRILAKKMEEVLGQPIVIVNKPGASGVIGLRAALRAKPDGYTLCGAALTFALTAPYFQGAEPFAIEEMEFIGGHMPQERVLFGQMDAPYKTFDEFLAFVKENPGIVTVGGAGAQWALEVMKSIAVHDGLNMRYVLFGGGAPCSAAILGRHVTVAETGVGTPAFQAAREGQLRLVVNLGSGTVPFFPEVENIKQRGYPFTTIVEYGWVAPGGTPEPIMKKLEDALKIAVEDPEVAESMKKIGLTPRFISGEELRKRSEEALNSVPELLEYNKALG